MRDPKKGVIGYGPSIRQFTAGLRLLSWLSLNMITFNLDQPVSDAAEILRAGLLYM